MELTVLLSKVFGIYLLIGGVAIWTKRAYFAPVLGNFAHDPLMRLVVGTIELTAGLFLVLSHNIWTSAAASIVSLFGWMLVLEGAFYMIAKDKVVEGMIRMLNVRAWYAFGGIFAFILGLYLCAFGFGWLS